MVFVAIIALDIVGILMIVASLFIAFASGLAFLAWFMLLIGGIFVLIGLKAEKEFNKTISEMDKRN